MVAPDKKAAAAYYPALYWFSLLQVPPKSDFPGTGPAGNGISPNVKSQGEWIRDIVNTDGCTGCHQMGDKATRELPQSILGETADSKAAWDLRIKAGQAGGGSAPASTRSAVSARSDVCGLDRPRLRRASYRSATPPRPQGRERNVVVTLWDWADPKAYRTTRSQPTSAIPP